VAPVRLETVVRAWVFVPGGLALAALSIALGTDLRWSDFTALGVLALGCVWYVWSRRRKIRRAARVMPDGPVDDRSTLVRRELLLSLPLFALIALLCSAVPFVGLLFGVMVLVFPTIDVAEVRWVKRFEDENDLAVVRVVGLHWNSPRYALVPPSG
jgi:hypothetical protein